MKKPSKVIAWGSGALGSANPGLLPTRPQYRLVGTLARSKPKVGKDLHNLASNGGYCPPD